MKLKFSEVFLLGLFIVAMSSYFIVPSRDGSGAARLSASSVGQFAYLDGVLHFPDRTSRYVGHSEDVRVGAFYAVVGERLFLAGHKEVNLEGRAVKVSENCIAIEGDVYRLVAGELKTYQPLSQSECGL